MTRPLAFLFALLVALPARADCSRLVTAAMRAEHADTTYAIAVGQWGLCEETDGHFARLFDALGDIVELTPAREPSFQLRGPWAKALAGETRPNLVQRVVQLYLETLEDRGLAFGPFAMTLEKRLPINSGLGSSGSSIAAALTALQAACGNPLRSEEVLALAGAAEGIYGGGAHFDNVAPSLLGGLRLVT